MEVPEMFAQIHRAHRRFLLMRKIREARHSRKNTLLLRLHILNLGAFPLRGVMWLLVAVHRTSQRKQHYPVPKKSLSSFEKHMAFIGWTLIWTGIICNEWVLTKLLSPDGVVEIQNRVAVWLFDILCIALGLFCVQMGKRLASRNVLRRLSQSYPRTCACFLGLVLTVLLFACAEGIFYGLNHYQNENVVEEISWVRLPPPE